MRTKTLVLAAAALAAGLATSVAQSNVYSLNIVGYVNLSLTNGFTMMANQLDLDGTGTNNTVNSVFSTNLPGGAVVYAFSGGAFASPAASYSKKSGWTGDTNSVNAALNPGGGVFLALPSPTNLTLVGTVLTGNLTNNYGAGYNIIASKIPQAGAVQTALGWVPAGGEVVYQFQPTNQAYVSPAYSYSKKSGWTPNEPAPGVGESFWLASPGAGQWTRTFTVGP